MTRHPERSNATLVATVALAMGVMSFDQCSIGYLLPFMKPALGLSNTAVGMITSAYWVTFAIASYAVGIVAGGGQTVRNLLAAVLGAFGAMAVLSGMVDGLASLLLARATAGALAGALFTLGQLTLGLGSPPERMAGNMGLVTALGGSLCGLVLAPVILVRIASVYGWRSGYFVIVAPALLAAVLVLRSPGERATAMPRAASATPGDSAVAASVRAMTRHRNIPLCALLCSLCIAYIGLGLTFLPSYFVEVRGYSPTAMSTLIPVLGLSSIVFAIVLPRWSDRWGRKPVLAAACAVGVLAPAAALAYQGPVPGLVAILFVGWAMSGTGSFSMGIIPAESIDATLLARALGIVIAAGVLTGGLTGPMLAGWSADRWGSAAPLVVQAGCATMAALCALLLRETAPGVSARVPAHRSAGTDARPAAPEVRS